MAKLFSRRKILTVVLVTFVAINVVAIFHSYKFTHFNSSSQPKTKNPDQLSLGEKLITLALGVSNPRPENKQLPNKPFEKVSIKSNRNLECWLIKTPNPLGTVILFHGFSGEKSSMLDKAEVFLNLGYQTLLVDFMGSGGSEGNQTTVGFLEAEQVKSCFDYASIQANKKVILFGTSMGAVAIMKAISDYNIKPTSIIIECPFGSMYKTVCARFKSMNAPTFPMAGLLVFWGGIQNGFWAFGHNPTEYAKNINCPTLLLHGKKDDKVSIEEIDNIYSNINTNKELIIYPEAGHENYLVKYPVKWQNDVSSFLSSLGHSELN
jgi:alpha-beta hydrolase superfamily lysophospholipase